MGGISETPYSAGGDPYSQQVASPGPHPPHAPGLAGVKGDDRRADDSSFHGGDRGGPHIATLVGPGSERLHPGGGDAAADPGEKIPGEVGRSGNAASFLGRGFSLHAVDLFLARADGRGIRTKPSLSREAPRVEGNDDSPVLGFFYIPDAAAASSQPKEKATSIVITDLEGNPSTKDLEQEFTGYLGSGWRCTARPLNKNQYTMRFPNHQEVQKAYFFGKKMGMRTCQAIINLTHWFAVVGASGMLNKAWVRVRNIPGDKRCDENVAYVGSLVGVTLEVDQATLHIPDYCRILLGCRDIDKLPEEAEGVLGDFFYNFFNEVESVVVNGEQELTSSVVNVSSSAAPSAPSHKRPRFHNDAPSESSEGQTNTSQFLSHGKQHCNNLEPVQENEEEDEENDEEDLLINVIAKQKLVDDQMENGVSVEREMEKNNDTGDVVTALDDGMSHFPAVLDCEKCYLQRMLSQLVLSWFKGRKLS
ncbi:hypothetical protein ACQ4PT_038094 [Festuca glaucescens]